MKIYTFRALRHRNFRLYFTGQSVSMTGTWMQRTAIYWTVYEKTNSAFMLGLVVFASQFPSFLFSPLGGVLSDRYNRYRITLAAQTASMVQATILAMLVLFTPYKIWEIFLLSILQGIINAFDLPARQSLVNEIVSDKRDLVNAIALNSTVGKLAWLAGPALAGILLEKIGAGSCFAINAFSYLAVIASLWSMEIPAFRPQPHTRKAFAEFRDGFRYIKNTPELGMTILLLACVSLLVLPFTTLLPVFAKLVFLGDASTYGYLNSMIGLGSLAGAIVLASLRPGRNLTNILFVNLLILGICLLAFSLAHSLPLALAVAFPAGLAMMSQTTLGNTILQVGSSDQMRGRVLSFFGMAFFGLQPLGGLLVGSLSHYTGAPLVIFFQGIAALVIAASFLWLHKSQKMKPQ